MPSSQSVVTFRTACKTFKVSVEKTSRMYNRINSFNMTVTAVRIHKVLGETLEWTTIELCILLLCTMVWFKCFKFGPSLEPLRSPTSMAATNRL